MTTTKPAIFAEPVLVEGNSSIAGLAASGRKTMALPFTLPFLPDRARVAMLNLVHALRSRPSASTGELDFDFDESAITIGKDAFPP